MKKKQPQIQKGRWLTRSIHPTVQCILWGNAAGRCEFSGCNKPLWRSSVTKERLNLAQKAHIYSFSAEGPRGNRGVPEKDLNQVSNLMLVCPECHLKIDQRLDGGRYTVATLQGMKRTHERRVKIATSFGRLWESDVLVYSTNIGNRPSPYLVDELADAMFKSKRFPASEEFRDLSTFKSAYKDKSGEFWTIETANLRRNFDQQIKARLDLRQIRHLSVFAIAPQPLLVLLGTLLGDIVPCDVYQRHREPATWPWPDRAEAPLLKRVDPSNFNENGAPALVLATSATVTHDRIHRVLGTQANVWTITIARPHNDSTKTREQISRFRNEVRLVLDQIKALYSQNTLLHIFPVTSVSMAVELGRVHTPKADMPMRLYDEIPGEGFVHAFDIVNGESPR